MGNNSSSPTLMKLAAAVRRYRKRAELTQLQLAELIPCSDRTVSAIETGRERPSRAMVVSDVNPSRSGAFTIGTLDGGEVAYIETAVRGIVASGRSDIGRLNDVWETLRSHALSQRESLDFITRTAEKRWT
jgi:DNA-binding XRE family transcriptional regulator